MFFSAETSFGVSTYYLNETSMYAPRDYLDLKVAIEKTIGQAWTDKDPIKYAQIKHPKALAVSILGKD